jgi:hypothetical protein
MGYLLKKTEDSSALMFYSKPEYGHYRGDNTCISKTQYAEWEKEGIFDEHNDMFWISGEWYDVTNATKPEANGVWVTDFVADCILQGEKLEINTPYEF